MRRLQMGVVNIILVVLCTMVLEAVGTPVVEAITWGADQIDVVVQQIHFALPTWMETPNMEQIVHPVQDVVERTVDWVAQR